MNPHEIQAVDAESLETILDRLHRALFCVVINDLVRPAEFEKVALLTEIPGLRVNFVQYDPAHLGTEPVLVALVFGQHSTNIL